MRRPIILLPPSKGKASGGAAPAYARTLSRHPLAAHRRAVLEAAVASADEADDAVLARRCGVAERDAEAARSMLRGLASAPTMPAHRRYTGIVHGNAGLAAIDPQTAGADVRIFSALMGLVALDEPVPAYRLEVAATLPGLGGRASGSLATFWRDRLDEELCRTAGGKRVWDLLPSEHARMWPAGVRDDLDVVTVRFVRPDGRPANAARTKVAKGRLTALLLAAPRTTPAGLARASAGEPLGEGWSIGVEDSVVTATFAG
jgi:cytoplasmic iron level regulating protein YaaA (DUF328/UPF0246 family)